MQQNILAIAFDKDRAAGYDQKMELMLPVLKGLHRMIRIAFMELPANARILCVGAGTGVELVELAEAYPEWHFTVVEPAEHMLAVCKQRAADHRFQHRCDFHQSYLSTLPAAPSFDGATCLLVSQFFMVKEERSTFFAEIATRLLPGGLLVSSDLSAELASEEYTRLLPIWVKMLVSANYTPDDVSRFKGAYGTAVAVLPVHEVEEIISAGGFESPLHIYQAMLIHAWLSRRA